MAHRSVGQFKPQQGLWLVTLSGKLWLEATQLTPQLVGAKAFGLAAIPEPWTLPFFVIGSDLFKSSNQHIGDITSILTPIFLETLSAVAEKIGIKSKDLILTRSSAVTEGVEERGKFHSETGPFGNLSQLIQACCTHLTQDPETSQSTICFIVQKQSNPVRIRGHLSNERRLAKESRDWVYQCDDAVDGKLENGQIAIRPWREGTVTQPTSLKCPYEVSLAQVLRQPARWAHSQGLRIHFEWVWNGNQIYLVQADPTPSIAGVNPKQLAASLATPLPPLNLRSFRRITNEDGKKYPKVENVLVYRQLGIPTTDLFILDRPDILAQINLGIMPEDLLYDIELLVKRSLVLRTDLNTDNLDQRQMLPRSDEVRSVQHACDHMITTVQKITTSGVDIFTLAIIAHHFIPAVTSAWSYAEPKSRKVLIEALWGIPEGLYYFSHDTLEVDTLRKNARMFTANDQERFSIVERIRYKHHFVAPTANGEWKTHVVDEQFDWRPSIQQRAWTKQIAYESRRIADYTGHAVNIMWFVDLPTSTKLPKVLPWYHEYAAQRPQVRRTLGRKKLVTERDHSIETIEDIAALEQLAQQEAPPVKRIRIRPLEATLLRDKKFPQRIGELAKLLNAVIVLEGGLLSHAYYILCRTGAEVETVDNFFGDDDVREYHKLIRDLLPKQITDSGEEVIVARLKGDALVQALRTKLVEEAIEALDAPGYDAFIEELADVMEVLDSIRQRLKLRKRDLIGKQRAKKLAKGGFTEGYVLIETRNPSIGAETKGVETGNLFGESEDLDRVQFTEIGYTPFSTDLLQRSIDRRHLAQDINNMNMLTIEVPLLNDKWEGTTGEISASDSQGRSLTLRSRLVGRRIGSILRLELSIKTLPNQLTLDLAKRDNDDKS